MQFTQIQPLETDYQTECKNIFNKISQKKEHKDENETGVKTVSIVNSKSYGKIMRKRNKYFTRITRTLLALRSDRLHNWHHCKLQLHHWQINN